jgi:signal transduction histidine kinase
MLRKLLFVITPLIVCSVAAFAQGQFGTAAEAKAMLEKAVTAVKADKAKALDMFQKGEGGFKDRDLYAFCANASDGVITAHPSLKGQNIREVKDKNGKALGADMMRVATEGKFDEVSYMWPRPGTDTTPVQKVSFVTKVADQVCAVGYYK